MSPNDFTINLPCDTCEYIEFKDQNGKTRCFYKLGFKIAFITERDGKSFTQVKLAYLSSRKPFEIGELVTIGLVPSYSKESSKNDLLTLRVI